MTLLFTFIEFFEKLRHTSDAGIASIFRFLVFLLIPTFFYYVPLSSWLASCMLIKEMQQQREWEIIRLIGVKKRTIFFLLIIASSTLLLATFIGKEFFSYSLEYRAQTTRKEVFKHRSTQTLLHTWFSLDNNFCYLDMLDLRDNTGSTLLIFKYNNQFQLQTIFSASNFTLNSTRQTIHFTEAQLFDATTNVHQIKKKYQLYMPGFFTQLHMKIKTPSFSQLINYLTDEKLIPNAYIRRTILHQFIKRILWYVHIIFFIFIPFLLFFMHFSSQIMLFITLLSIYPFFFILTSTTDALVRNGASPLLHIFTHTFACIFIAGFALFKRKNSR